jgi:hypothetical protein
MIMPLNVISLSHHHCWFDYDWRFDLFSSPRHYGVAYGHILRARSRISKWKIAFGNILRFDPNATSSWGGTWILKGLHSSKSQTPSSVVLLYFSKLLHLGDFVANQFRLWWRIWNRLWRLLRNRWHWYLHMVFSFRRKTLLLVVRTNSSTTS